MNNIFYNKKDECHYFNDINKKCDWCDNIVEEAIIIKVYFDKLGSGIRYYCFNCRNKENLSATVVETYIAVVTNNIHKDCIPIFIHKPLLSDSKNISVFDIKEIHSLGGSTSDKTVFSSRDSLEGASIGNKELIFDLDDKDNKLLDIDDGLKLIENLGSLQPLIEDNVEDVKKLENKKE